MYVLDASAILALIYDEPGADDVMSRLPSSLISSVNFAEVLQKSATAGRDPERVALLLRKSTMGIVPFDHSLASDSAALWSLTKRARLSLADRSCLALAAAVGAVAVTADKSWSTLAIPAVAVHVIR